MVDGWEILLLAEKEWVPITTPSVCVSITRILEKILGELENYFITHGKYDGTHVIDFFFSMVNKMCCTQPIKILLRCQLFNLSPLFMNGHFFSKPPL